MIGFAAEGTFGHQLLNGRSTVEINKKEVEDLAKAKIELPNHAFLAENLYNQGFELIPIISSGYSETLKSNFKEGYSPVLFYIKGNKKIMELYCI